MLLKEEVMKRLERHQKTKRDLYYEEAQSLYLSGVDLPEIGRMLPVSLRTLRQWRQQGLWEQKRGLTAEHPRILSEVLKGLLRQKVQDLLARGDLQAGAVEELHRLTAIIERLRERAWDERAAVVEVMGLFGDFVRRRVRDKEELRRWALLVEEFFQEVSG